MKIEFSNNQYRDGIYLEPEIELKTFLLECGTDEFLDLYLTQLGITSRHLKFYKALLELVDKAGGFTLKELEPELLKRGFKLSCSMVYISELKRIKVGSTPVVKKVNNGMWKIPKDIMYTKNNFNNCEYRVYVVKK